MRLIEFPVLGCRATSTSISTYLYSRSKYSPFWSFWRPFFESVIGTTGHLSNSSADCTVTSDEPTYFCGIFTLIAAYKSSINSGLSFNQLRSDTFTWVVDWGTVASSSHNFFSSFIAWPSAGLFLTPHSNRFAAVVPNTYWASTCTSTPYIPAQSLRKWEFRHG